MATSLTEIKNKSDVVILFSNTVDILYFDIRISVLSWLLIAGLRNISQEQIR